MNNMGKVESSDCIDLAAARCRILIVDDEPRLLTSMAELIELAGYRHRACANGSEAIAALKEGGFDLVLLDLVLPDMTGHDVMDFIAANEIKTSVIVVSGDGSINSAIGALRRGAYDFIRKPYQPEELLKTVENALRTKLLKQAHQDVNAKLEHSERLYRYLVDSSPDIIYTLDHQGNFTFLNNRIESLLGYSKDELIGKHYSTLVHEEDLERAAYVFNERRTGERASHNIELRLKRKNGAGSAHFEVSFVTIVLNSMGIYGDTKCPTSSSFAGTYGVARDISDRKRAEETISYQAYHDLLTDLPNRALFKDRLGVAMAQAKREGHRLAVMFFDLDRFKLVNDTLGHVKGDLLLQMVATRLKNSLRKGDTLARMGGDEFVLLLPHVGGRKDAAAAAQKILEAFQEPFKIDQQELFVTASIGIGMYPDDGDTIDALIKNADIAMYHVKWHGKNGYRFYSREMNAVFNQKLELENDLRKALERGEFVLYFQPQVDIVSGKIVGVEALIRWRHPSRGLLRPGDFIPLAEETGLITDISAWVLKSGCAQLKNWRDAGLPPVRLAANLSPKDVEEPHFVENVMQVIQEYSLSPEDLELEITESVIMRDSERTVAKLKKLGRLGVKISVDDFGTQYSSLNYLKKFPIHTIKIDQSFVHDITSDNDDIPIVTAIVAIAKGFRLNVVAEGVETAQQRDVLRSLDCREMQGFLFSKPIPPEEATRLLSSSSLSSAPSGLH